MIVRRAPLSTLFPDSDMTIRWVIDKHIGNITTLRSRCAQLMHLISPPKAVTCLFGSSIDACQQNEAVLDASLLGTRKIQILLITLGARKQLHIRNPISVGRAGAVYSSTGLFLVRGKDTSETERKASKVATPPKLRSEFAGDSQLPRTLFSHFR
jgi:hypothetical protein